MGRPRKVLAAFAIAGVCAIWIATNTIVPDWPKGTSATTTVAPSTRVGAMNADNRGEFPPSFPEQRDAFQFTGPVRDIPKEFYSEPLRTAVPRLRAAASAGDAESAYQLSRLVLSCAMAREPKPEDCLDWQTFSKRDWYEVTTKAARGGYVQAQTNLLVQSSSELSRPNPANRDALTETQEQALAMLKASSMAGSAMASGVLAWTYMTGELTPRDLDQAYGFTYLLTLQGSRDPVVASNLATLERSLPGEVIARQRAWAKAVVTSGMRTQ